ncbi:MAG: glycosyltransferase family 2 protein [Clostridium celatum]|nr:glycosyltransferase family 2 protein [Clostridium celatum]
MSEHLISIVVPVYNLEPYLDFCLDSIIEQTYQNLEIILVNDGSTDNSLNICEKYRKNDSRINVISQVNSGVSAARNTGLQCSNGDFFCFVDGDDYITPNYIQLLYEGIIRNKSDVSVCKIGKLKRNDFQVLTTQDLEVNYALISKNKALSDMLYQKGLSWEVVAKLYRKETLQDLRFDETESIGEDFTFSYQYLHNCNRITICNFTGYFYLLREGSATQSRFSEKHRSVLNVAGKFEKFISTHYPQLANCSNYFTLHSYVDLVDRIYFSEEYSKIELRKYKKEILHKLPFLISNSRIKLKFKIRVMIMLLNSNLYKFIKRKIR